MAAFDLAQQRVCVRVVYDGVASAGKTTNLRQLAELFVTQRTCEVFSPEELDGRTLYFDWLQIAAGMVCGFPLVCQVVTVPGQVVLTPRRRHLLLTADVVVYVCDSDESAVARAAEGLVPFDQVLQERGDSVPLVVQANKQDQATALSGAALLAALGRRDVPVVEAIATDGIGVIDTFVASVRAAVRSIQARVDRGLVRVAVQPAQTATDVLGQLKQVDVDPEWAAEMLLEQAANAFGATDLEELAPGWSEQAVAKDDEPETWRPERIALATPVLPTEHVPTGFIWPAHTGRASLRALAHEPEMGEPVTLEGDGTTRRSIGEFVLSTARDRRFENNEAARQALVRAARARTQLGALLEPETVLVAQPASDGSSWLWSIEPRMPTVAQSASDADRGDPVAKGVLAAYGSALADALRVEASYSVALDLSPRSFGVRHGTVRYIGDVAAVDPDALDTGHALEGAFLALATYATDLEPAVAALESALLAKLSAEELARHARSASWSDPATVPATVREALRRVESALMRGRRAA